MRIYHPFLFYPRGKSGLNFVASKAENVTQKPIYVYSTLQDHQYA